MSSWKQFFGGWAVLGGYIGLLFLLILVQGILDQTGLLPYRTSVLPFSILHLILLIGFFIVAFRSFNSPVYREAQSQGKAANAEILAVKKTGWRNWSTRGTSLKLTYPLPDRPRRTRKYEYELHLRVMPADAEPYETKVFSFLTTAEVPQPGSTIAVKIHPQRSDIVVLANEN